jgi:hypothetical protein
MLTVRTMKCAALTSIFFCGLCFGQDAPPTHPKPPVPSGIVEAVIGSGDLKPARFAQVLAVPAQVAGRLETAVERVSGVIEDARAKAERGTATDLVELQCVAALIQIEPALAKLRQSANENPSAGVVVADADELGEFTLNGLNKEPYKIFAIGKIGMNAAIWIVDFDPSGQPGRIKMVKARLACYDPNGYFKP